MQALSPKDYEKWLKIKADMTAKFNKLSAPTQKVVKDVRLARNK